MKSSLKGCSKFISTILNSVQLMSYFPSRVKKQKSLVKHNVRSIWQSWLFMEFLLHPVHWNTKTQSIPRTYYLGQNSPIQKKLSELSIFSSNPRGGGWEQTVPPLKKII